MTKAALALACATLGAPWSAAERPIVAVYRGTLPCDDCARVEAELTIRAESSERLADASYWLKETQRRPDGDRVFESGGSLRVRRGSAHDPQATVYELQEARTRQSRFFLLVGGAELRPLDARRAEIAGAAERSLKRVGPGR